MTRLTRSAIHCFCALIATAGCALASYGGAATQPTSDQASTTKASPDTIFIDNFTFNPSTLTVKAGTTVTWINRDDIPHTATSSAKPAEFDSKVLDTDGRFSFTFKTAGTYAYFCKIHPHMTGTVIVK